MTDPDDSEFSATRERWDAAYPAGDEYAAAVWLLRASRVLQRRIGSVLAGFELTMPQWSTLTVLELAPEGRRSLGAISQDLDVHTTTITNAIDRLELRGLVARAPSERDRRTVLAELTDDGRQTISAVNQALAAERFGFGDVAVDDVCRLLDLVARILRVRARP